MLSFIYRLLTRVRKLDNVTLDMIGTFEEARADALSRGPWNYFVFGIREISGLLGSRGWISRTWWALIPGTGLAGLAIGAGAFYVCPSSYTAESVLQLRPPSIPQSLIASGDTSDFARGLDEVKGQVLSRTRLLPIVERLNLYPHLSQGVEKMAVLEAVRKTIRVERSEDLIRVSFTYRDYPSSPDDPKKAAMLTNELTNLLIEENLRRQVFLVESTVEFFKRRGDEAGRSWEKLNTEIRGLPAKDPHVDRLILDRELARKEYESVRQKLSEAEGVKDLTIRLKAAKIQFLEAAQMPQQPDVSRLQMELSGLGGGLLIGFLGWLLLAMSVRHWGAPLTNSSVR
jgi:uncharacterized protein involved in exopolysaccharide biosynthesis